MRSIKAQSLSVGDKHYPLGVANGWVTFKDYAGLYDLKSINVIYNWIARGIISEEDHVYISELNVRLVRVKEYKSKK